MSFVSNPKKYDVNKNEPNSVNYGEIRKYENRLKNRVRSNPEIDDKVKDKIQEDVDMIVYLLEHPHRNRFKSNTINNIVCRVENMVDDIPGIKIDHLSEHKIGTITVG